jgi:phage baseplate assembly protein W
MAVKINTLEQISQNRAPEQKYLFKDLALDIKIAQKAVYGYDKTLPDRDIQASYDVAAIQNSLQNLFNTLPGQRFLFPEYGLDLNRYIFEPITKSNAEDIGRIILNTITRYEPRVNVVQINVNSQPDLNQYLITIIINIIDLNFTSNLSYTFNLNTQSFISIPTSRNT